VACSALRLWAEAGLYELGEEKWVGLDWVPPSDPVFETRKLAEEAKQLAELEAHMYEGGMIDLPSAPCSFITADLGHRNLSRVHRPRQR
jgi:hypothetical protein